MYISVGFAAYYGETAVDVDDASGLEHEFAVASVLGDGAEGIIHQILLIIQKLPQIPRPSPQYKTIRKLIKISPTMYLPLPTLILIIHTTINNIVLVIL